MVCYIRSLVDFISVVLFVSVLFPFGVFSLVFNQIREGKKEGRKEGIKKERRKEGRKGR